MPRPPLRPNPRAGACATRCCAAVGLLVLIAAAVGGWIAYTRMKAPPPKPPEARVTPVKLPPRKPLAEQIAKVAAASAAADKQAQASKQQPATKAKSKASSKAQTKPSSPAEVSFDIRPEDIVAMLSPQLKKAGVDDIQVYFGNGTIATEGSVKMKDRTQGFSARSRPELEGNKIKIQVIEARIGALPIPGATVAAFTGNLENKLSGRVREAAPAGHHLVIDSMKVTPGRMVVRGHVASR